MPRAGVSVKPERARHVEAWLDGSELDMFKRPSAARSDGDGAPARRTVTITGRGAERYNPRLEPGARSRPQRRRHERSDFRPDRAALWAVVLCLALVLLAATSSHAATLAAPAARWHSPAPAPRATP